MKSGNFMSGQLPNGMISIRELGCTGEKYSDKVYPKDSDASEPKGHTRANDDIPEENHTCVRGIASQV
jgi:hypothetical protein